MPPKRRSTRQRVSEEEEDTPEILVNGSSSTSVQQQDHLILHDAPREGSPSTAQVFLDQQDAGSDIPTALEKLKLFLVTAPSAWQPGQVIKRLRLPTKDTIACVLWNNLYHITGTDIVKALQFRFAAFGRPVKTHLHKKFEEGVFSDLRNLKPGVDATLEDPRSPLLDFLFKSNCIRTQKKQKVFYWFSVPHDRLFLDALERDLKRESQGLEPTTMPNGAMSADVTLNLAKQQCLPTFAVDASNPTTPNVFSRQGSVNSGIDQQLHQQYQDATALQQEYIQQALSAAASAANSPFIDAINPFQQQAFIPSASPHIQQHRLSPLQMSQQFPSQSPSIQHSSPESPNKRQRLEVPSSSTSPQHQSIKVTAPMSLLEGSPNFKQRSRSRVQASPGIANQAMNPDNFRSKDDKRHFVCNAPNCGQSFKRFEHLRRHFRLHTGEKPYHCQHNGCERSFARVDGLSSHLKTHGLSPAEITAAVRKQQEAAGDRHDGNTTEEEGDVPELVNEGPGESPMALLTPLSMMANAHAQQQGMHMFQQSVMMQNSMPPNAYQHHMEQLSAQAEMMHQQQQVGGEQFSTFFNIESPTSLNLPDASAFMPDGSQQKPFFTFQVPTHQFSADATYSMTNYPQARYGYDASSSQ